MKRFIALSGLAFSIGAGAILLTVQLGFGQSSTPSNSGATSDQVRNAPLSTRPADSETGPEADAPKTVYDKSGTKEKPEANPYGKGEARGKINFGKNGERVIVTNSSKPGRIRKTKDGSADATEPTGVFKKSFLDVSIDAPITERPAANTQAKSDKAKNSEVQPSASHIAIPNPPATNSQFDIKTGVSPAASASPSPHP